MVSVSCAIGSMKASRSYDRQVVMVEAKGMMKERVMRYVYRIGERGAPTVDSPQ